jgi:hypothetical protein
MTLDHALSLAAATIDAIVAAKIAESQVFLMEYGATFDECQAMRQWQLDAVVEPRRRALELVRALYETGYPPQ